MLGFWGVLGRVLTGEVPVCVEDLVYFDCTPDGGDAGEAAQA